MSDKILVGTRKGILTFERNSGVWKRTQEAFVGVHVSYAAADPNTGSWWGMLDHGHWGIKLHRSKDHGANWEETAAPKYDEGVEIKPGVPASTLYLWSLAFSPAGTSPRIYIGTIPGGLFTSDDDGASWQINQPLWNHPTRETWMGIVKEQPGIHSICIHPKNPQHIYIAVSAAGVFETKDGGESWAPRNKGCSSYFLPEPEAEVGHDPHQLVQCQSNPDVLWQQNHCSIYRTADGCSNWTDIAEETEAGPAKFGFAVACDPANADTAWVIPAVKDERRVAVDRALCVSRTTDGGKTWQALREGLPQADCYDFAFRHALDLDGDRLVFGTTGGSLYVSDDRGESWQTIGNHFPPVHSVRFIRGE